MGSYWKSMTKDVTEYCKSCDTCQKVNSKFTKQCPELHPIPASDVWKHEIDLVGSLPETDWGSRYIITATDHISKWLQTAPLLDKTAVDFSSPSSVTTDDLKLSSQTKVVNSSIKSREQSLRIPTSSTESPVYIIPKWMGLMSVLSLIKLIWALIKHCSTNQ